MEHLGASDGDCDRGSGPDGSRTNVCQQVAMVDAFAGVPPNLAATTSRVKRRRNDLCTNALT